MFVVIVIIVVALRSTAIPFSFRNISFILAQLLFLILCCCCVFFPFIVEHYSCFYEPGGRASELALTIRARLARCANKSTRTLILCVSVCIVCTHIYIFLRIHYKKMFSRSSHWLSRFTFNIKLNIIFICSAFCYFARLSIADLCYREWFVFLLLRLMSARISACNRCVYVFISALPFFSLSSCSFHFILSERASPAQWCTCTNVIKTDRFLFDTNLLRSLSVSVPLISSESLSKSCSFHSVRMIST